MSRDSRVVGEAFVNGDPNTWDNLVLSLAGVKQVEPYPTPCDASKRSFPITPLTEGQ